MLRARDAVLAAFLVSTCGPAVAQTPPAGPSAAPRTDLDGEPGTIGDKLRRTGGVIAPEGNVDPAMRKAPAATGTMPVIKPGTVAPGTAR